MSNKTIISLNSKELPEISEVGGKGYSLIKLNTLDLNVPPGIVLTINFFKEWIDLIKKSDLYKKFLELLNKEKKSEECSYILNQIKEWSIENLKLNEENKKTIQKYIKNIFPNDFNKISYAVRSSSPEEDLSGASFAGNYETYLGIQYDSLEKYILKSFISCLDFRVFKYKLEKSFNVSDVKIAIVIMKQINCDVSGVGFSINPINNDYDEAVINSNFGLGESVVGGIITPDEYIVNKIKKNIISEKIGRKEKYVKLNENKNETSIIAQSEENQKISSLTQEQIIEIVEAIINIEKEYKIPIDIEFGIEKNILYILQARPITTYNKLPDILLTKPNERRQLYFDGTLGVQGFEKPLSNLGATLFKILAHYAGIKILGSYNIDNIKESAIDLIGGKMIMNLSNMLTKISKEGLINFLSSINRVISETLAKYSDIYKNDKVCYEIDVSLLGMAWRLPIKRIIFYNYFAKSTKENFEYYLGEFTKKYEKYIEENLSSDVPIITILNKIGDELTNNLRDYIVPLMVLGMIRGYNQVKKLFEKYTKENPELKKDINNLTKSFPLITIQMGLDLYKLSQYLDKTIYKNKTQEEFYQDFLTQKFPKEFYKNFIDFMKKYGFRGEGELDIINERYSENPKKIINQIYSSLLFNDENNNPQKDFDDTNAKRPALFKKLLEFAKEKGFSYEFEQAYNIMINYFPYRESPKYYIIFVIGKMRELILKRANILLEKKLIDDLKDIFKLNIYSLNDILQNVNNYTKEKIYSQMKKDNELNEMISSWKRFPIIFDSRGRLFFQEKKISNKTNELMGDTVSFGKIRGKAKVLNSVDEKPFNPGEILITKATDPGWTPLIINCGGIVLEIGGMLQHGALVSREFNKPCVVGVENATKIIKDGEEVEVDAIEGVVRLLDRKE